MKNFAVYTSNGEILRTGYCQDMDLSLQAGGGEFVAEASSDVRDDTHWYSGGNFLLKVAHTATLSDTTPSVGQAVTLTNIPTGTSLRITGDGDWQGSVAENDTLSFDEVGSYTLAFSLFPYLEQTIEVNVT